MTRSGPKFPFNNPSKLASSSAQRLRETTQRGTIQSKASVLSQQRSAAQSRPKPVAPPVYRPQPVPKVLQTKATTVKHGDNPGLARKLPVAPPVYRPQPVPKVLQQKKAGALQSTPTIQAHRSAVPPPVYKPQPTPRVLQTKTAASQNKVVQNASVIQRTRIKLPRKITLKLGQQRMTCDAPIEKDISEMTANELEEVVALSESDDEIAIQWELGLAKEVDLRRRVLLLLDNLEHLSLNSLTRVWAEFVKPLLRDESRLDREELLDVVEKQIGELRRQSDTGQHSPQVRSDLQRSVLTQQTVELIFGEVMSKHQISTKGEDGCELRAQAMCELIDKLYPKVARNFLTKEWLYASGRFSLKPGTYGWNHHVAPAISVNGTKYVLDPAVSPNRPLELSEWIKLMKDPSLLHNTCDWGIVWRQPGTQNPIGVEFLPPADREDIEKHKARR